MKRILVAALCLALLLTLAAPAFAVTVQRSAQGLTVNGNTVACEKYNIDGSNYFKLRDLACILQGTPAEFGVGWDAEANAILIIPGMPYEPVGGELVIGADKSATAVPSSQSLWFLDAPADGLSVYNIGGNNYFKLRELGDLLGFEVGYDAAADTAMIFSEGASGDVGDGQAPAFNAIRAWVEDNANGELAGGPVYAEVVGVGDYGELCEIFPADYGALRFLVLRDTFEYPNGACDVTWLFLEPDTQTYVLSYDYFEEDNAGEDADFTGSLELYAPAFAGSRTLVFEKTEGPLAAQAEERGFALSATHACSDLLYWLDDLLRGDPVLSGAAHISDFGFDYGSLDASAVG